MTTDSQPTDTHELSRAIEQVIGGFEAALRQGLQPALEAHLPVDPSLRPRILRELIHTELEYRLKAGERCLAEEYFRRFPEVAADRREAVELIAAEYQFTRRLDDGVTPTAFLDRFAELREALAPILGDVGNLPSLPGYEILDILGRGGMGVVYRARQPQLGRVVALKVILAGAHASEEEQERFRTEARTVAALQHPNIVQIHEVGSHQGQIWLTLEFCAGGTLADKLRESTLPVREAAELVRTLAQAMQVAHQQQIVHRDLKPANVLLARGEQPVEQHGSASPQLVLAGLTPRISDFGLAKKLDASQITRSGAVLGTPSYMAPEQARGTPESITVSTDVYALGAILYECLTGRPPFKAATALDTMLQVLHDEPVPPASLQPGLSRDLETITLKCLQKDPQKRYATAQALADDLGRYLEGKTIAARPVSPLERSWRWCRRNPVVASLSAALVLVLLAASVGFYTLWRQAEGNREALKKLLAEVVTTTTTRLAQLDAEQRGPMRRQLDAAQEAAARFGQLPGAGPEEERFLTVVHGLQGDLKQEADPQGALEAYGQAAANARRLVQTRADNPQLLKDLIFMLDRIGRVQLKSLRQPHLAGEAFDEALSLARKLALEHPEEEAQRLVITCLNDRGDAYFDLGDLPRSEAAFAEARERTEQLVHRFPERILLQHDLSIAEERVGQLQAARGNAAAALKSRRRAVELREAVVAAEPANRSWKVDLCTGYRELGQLLDLTGASKQAIEVYQKGYSLNAEITRPEQASAGELNELAIWHQRLGTIYLREDDVAAARTSLEAFVQLMQEVIKRDSSQSSLYQRNLSVGYNSLGRLFEHISDHARTREYYQKSLPIAQELARRHPQDALYQRDLALLHFLLGFNAANLNEIESARKSYLEALAGFDRLAGAQPELLERQQDVAHTCEKLCRIALVSGGDADEALTWAVRGLAALEPFAKQNQLAAFRNASVTYQDLQGLKQQAEKQRGNRQGAETPKRQQ